MVTTSQRSVQCNRSFITYPTKDRLYGLCWRPDAVSLRIAASTFIPGEYANKIEVTTVSFTRVLMAQMLSLLHLFGIMYMS